MRNINDENNIINYINSLDFSDFNMLNNLEKIALLLDQIETDKTNEFYKKIFTSCGNLRTAISNINDNQYIMPKISNNIAIISLISAYNEIYNIEDIDDDSNVMFCGDIVSQYFKSINKYPLLSFEEEKELFKKYKQENDECAKNELIVHNLKLVVAIAKKRFTTEEQFMDLISEGNIGLMKAIENFDYRKNYRFSTYAIWWIKHYITRYIYNSSVIRISIAMREKINAYNRAKEKLTKELNREPSREELSNYLNVPISNIKDYELFFNTKVISLQDKIEENEDDEIIDTIPDPNCVDIQAEIEKNLVGKEIENLLNQLDEKEKIVIVCRFGFLGEEMTLEQTIKILNKYGYDTKTREGIRVIEVRALKKLNKFKDLQNLRDNSNTKLNPRITKKRKYNSKKTKNEEKTEDLDIVQFIYNIFSSSDPNYMENIVEQLPQNYIEIINKCRKDFENLQFTLTADELSLIKNKIVPMIEQELNKQNDKKLNKLL